MIARFITWALLVVSIDCTHAQQVSYFDYEAFPMIVRDSLRATQGKALFRSQDDLKANCITAPNEVAKSYSDLPAPYKKICTPQQLARQIRPSSLVVCKLKRGFGIHEDFVILYASAVVLRKDGLCASNYHVFASLIDEGEGLMPQDSLYFVADAHGTVYPITGVERYSQAADLAIFKIDPHGHTLVPAPLGHDLEVGARVHTMTHPNQQAYYYTQGFVARNSTFAHNAWENRCEITADFGVGSSGGPVFDDYGNVVAIVSSTNAVYAGSDQNPQWQMVMKITIPVSSIRKLISS